MAIQTQAPPPPSTLPTISTIQKAIAEFAFDRSAGHNEDQLHLALQVAHNLRFQHGWQQVRVCLDSTAAIGSGAKKLPRPLITGVPPQRLYIHPDEQLSLLQRQKAEGKVRMPELKSQREWVLLTQLREKWSLGKFAEVFDSIEHVPPTSNAPEPFPGDDENEPSASLVDADNTWRTEKAPKRLLLATVDDDSTVVYYIVHDGMVKPRQN